MIGALVSGISGVVSIGLGETHSCAADSTGAVYCWGVNSYGKLGDGTLIAHSTPALVTTTTTGFGSVVSVSSGYNHTCALTSAGDVYCWGHGSYGQVGDGTATTANLVPTAVSTFAGGTKFTNAIAIGVGLNHSCAVISGGTVQCWGDNTAGQLGNGLTTNSNVPVLVSGITNAIAVTAGTLHTCALLATNRAKCWGDGIRGQLGDGSTTSSLTPVNVSGLSTIVKLDAGNFFTCAQLSTGAAKCWGSNGYSNLGDGTTTQQNSPVSVGVLSDGVDITAGLSSTCALRSGGGVKCWGRNNDGQLGIGTTTVTTSVVDVLGLP